MRAWETADPREVAWEEDKGAGRGMEKRPLHPRAGNGALEPEGGVTQFVCTTAGGRKQTSPHGSRLGKGRRSCWAEYR